MHSHTRNFGPAESALQKQLQSEAAGDGVLRKSDEFRKYMKNAAILTPFKSVYRNNGCRKYVLNATHMYLMEAVNGSQKGLAQEHPILARHTSKSVLAQNTQFLQYPISRLLQVSVVITWRRGKSLCPTQVINKWRVEGPPGWVSKVVKCSTHLGRVRERRGPLTPFHFGPSSRSIQAD